MHCRCDICSIFSSKLAEPPEGLQVMGVEDPDFTSLCRLAKESRGALPRQVSRELLCKELPCKFNPFEMSETCNEVGWGQLMVAF